MGPNGQRLVDLAAPQHLDLRALVGQPMCVQLGGRDLAVEVRGEHLDVHRRVLHPVGVREPLELRDPALVGHLTALEVRRDVLARAGALRAAARGLAARAGTPAPDAGALRLGALGGMQMVELHPQTSCTVTRWRTFAIMPRISGRSSLTTVSCIWCR